MERQGPCTGGGDAFLNVCAEQRPDQLLDQCGQTPEEIYHRCAIITCNLLFRGRNGLAIARSRAAMQPHALAGKTPVNLNGQMMVLHDFVNEIFQNRNYPAHEKQAAK
jgi:hypothetical protein